jgi:curved DNA-binding protein CbpA
MQTLYETLGLPKTAKPEQIKRAFRILVKRFHPDLFPSSFKSAKAISLRRKNKRAEIAIR